MHLSRNFASEVLHEINKADNLQIAPFRKDGITYGTPTWVWSVVVDDNLFVRPYNGKNSRWYRSAVEQKAGRIYAAGMVIEVIFETASNELYDKIDSAYKEKYCGSPYLPPMISNSTKAATVRIIPKI